MNKKSIKFVSVLTLVFMLIQVIPVQAIGKSINTIDTKVLTEGDTVLNAGYVNSFKAKVSKVENNGGQYIAKVDAAFDGNWNTYWKTNKPNNSTFKNEIVVTFEELTTISKIIYGLRQDIKDEEGYAKSLALYVSKTDSGDDFEKVATAVSQPTTSKVQFTLKDAVQAKRAKLVYEDVNRSWASAGEIIFLKEDKVLDTVVNIFETNEKYSLKAEYSNYEAIQNLEKMVQTHTSKDSLMTYIDRAYKIINGEIDIENIPEKAIDFPVHIIQKTGPDNEKLNMVFLAEGYTASEQDKFIKDLNERVTKMLEIEPFKSFANEINVYAIKVLSNESGAGRFASTGVSAIEKDTYFNIKFNYRGTDRSPNFDKDGKAKADKLVKQFTENYLDKGSKVFMQSVLINSDYYGGSGGDYAIASLPSGEITVAHEAMHSATGLMDEYFAPSQGEAPNRTQYNNPETIKWKEFLGFRGIDIYLNGTEYNGTKIYKPSQGTCMMETIYSNEYCEVCKHHIVKSFNEKIKNKRESYVANPIVTIDSTGKELTNANIIDANNQALKLRTVIQNFTAANKNYTLRLSIENAQGQVKQTVENTFTIGANTLKSVEVKTNVLSGIASTDKVVVKVIDKDTNKEIGNTKDYGTVTVEYKLGNEKDKTNTDIGAVATRTFAIKAGTEYKVEAPKVKGFINTGSNQQASSLLVQAGTNTKVTYYYANAKGKVDLVLKDSTGKVIKTGYRYLNYNTPFVPSDKDFGIVDGYKVTAPTTIVTFNGVDSLKTIEYTAAPSGTTIEKEVKVRAMSKGVVLGEISLGKKVAGTTIQVNAPTVAEIPAINGYKLTSEAIKTVALTNDTNVQVVDFEYAKEEAPQTPPTLTGVVDKTIKVGDVFDKMAGVTAKDQFGTDITSSIVVTGAVDTAKAGNYTLTYTAKDSRGLETSLSRVITVEEKAVAGDTFDATKVYNTGDIVIYKGVKYRAKYWTQGGTPETNSAWERVVETNPDGSKPYVPGMAYNTGDIVVFEGKKYKANWWTNTVPGSDSSWTLVG